MPACSLVLTQRPAPHLVVSACADLLVRKNTSRVTCAVRAAMVKFLMWVYESDAASDIASSLYYVPLPTFVL